MARLERRTATGQVAVVGARPDMLEAAVELVLHDHGTGVERVEILTVQAWFKRSTLRGGSRWRWALKHVLGAPLPRVREQENLVWLERNRFQVPEPLAAGWSSRNGIPLRQFLLTRDVPGAITLEAFLRSGERAERPAILDEVARETARMHALGFVHHDLYPRNILVLPRGEPRRIAFVDAWAGGPPPQRRPAAYDLACFLLRADSELSAEEVAQFMELYAGERATHGPPIVARQVLDQAKRMRARLVKRLIARPHERRGEPLPGLDW